MTDKAYAVPLHELLASVPREARLVIDDDGMGTRFIPVGRYCNEAAEALRARLAQPEREWQGLTDEEIKNHWLIAMQSVEGTFLPIPEFARAIEAKLKEKNGY